MSKMRMVRAALLLLMGFVFQSGSLGAASLPAVPEALVPLDAKVGNHWAFKGTTLSFKAEQPLSPAQWAAIEAMPAAGVKLFYVSGKGIGDADVERFAAMPLEGLSIDGGTLSDAVFASIGKIKTLKTLGLSHAQKLKGEGTKVLAELPVLERVGIGGTGFGDAGMAGLAAIKTLKKLELNHDQVTDVGLAALANHPALDSLMVSPQMTPRIGDPSLATIATIKSLKELTINQTVLTYEGGLKHLKDLQALEKLNLAECGIDEADLAKLKADLPAKVQLKFTPATTEAVAKWRQQAEKKAANPAH